MFNRSLLTIVCFAVVSFLCFSYFSRDRPRAGEGTATEEVSEETSASRGQDEDSYYDEAAEQDENSHAIATGSGRVAIIPEQPAPSSYQHDGGSLETEVQDKMAELKTRLQEIKVQRQPATEAGIAALEIEIAQLEEQITASQNLNPANRLTLLAQASGQLQDFEQKLASLATLLY